MYLFIWLMFYVVNGFTILSIFGDTQDQFLGCYDSTSSINQPPYRGIADTIEECFAYCIRAHSRPLKTFAIVRTLNKGEPWCYCSDNILFSLAGDCLPSNYVTCPGNQEQFCGGPARTHAMIYSVCPQNRYGLSCERDCHCTGDLGCQVANGRCTSRQCLPGYTGDACNKDFDACQSDPCQNGATCEDDAPPLTNYQCRCLPGYTGSKCQFEIDECQSQPCQNGATCMDGVGSFYCSCPTGFTGIICEIDENECGLSPCENGGVCENHPGYFTCQCSPGYTGFSCRTDIDECESNPCIHGNCEDSIDGYICQCIRGYTGETCEEEIDECLSRPCLNNGMCVNLVGEYKCNCSAGTEGANCEIDYDECQSSPCLNNGTCEDLINSYKCHCVPGFAGNDCLTEVPECLSSPCKNEGICQAATEGYHCECTEVFMGQNCDTLIGAHTENPMHDVTMIIVPIIIVLLLSVIIVSAIVFIRSRNKTPPPPAPSMEDINGNAPITSNKSMQRVRKSWKESFVKRLSRNPSVLGPSTEVLLLDVVAKPSMLSPTEQGSNSEGAYGSLPPIRDVYTPIKKVRLEHLRDHIIASKCDNNTMFQKEYSAIKLKSDETVTYGSKLSLKAKNKYKDILPYDRTRVVLSHVADDVHSDYINANWIKGFHTEDVFIASQAPWYTTLGDFWRMIWENNAPIIVMVTQFIELGKRKVEQYFPEDVGGTDVYDNIKVEFLAEEVWLDYTIKSFNITKDEETRMVRHFHFTAWPDHGVPDHGTALANFQRRVRSEMAPGKPVVIHCSAGVGRTGTYISLDQLLQQGEKDGFVDVPACLTHIRKQRPFMVQTLAQYVFIYDALWEAFAVGDTVIRVADFKERFCTVRRGSLVSSHPLIKAQFDVLEMIQRGIMEPDCTAALKPQNSCKNRRKCVLPPDNKRVRLMTTGDDMNEYINAVVVDGHKKKNEFIATQTPLENTILDFWRMILDYKCRDIIVITNHFPDGLIPDKRIPIKFGRYSVSLEAEERDCGCSAYSLVIAKETKSGAKHADAESVAADYVNIENVSPDRDIVIDPRLVVVPLESEEEFCGPDFESLLLANNLVERRRIDKDNGPIVVVCDNACTWCGFYIGVSSIFQMVQRNQQVDIFSICKQLKTNSKKFIATRGMYELMHDTANKYIARYSEVIQ